jgi:hypothetical protein
MGAPIDTEGTSIALYGTHELRDLDLMWSIGQYDINQSSLSSHRLTPIRTDGLLVTLGLTKIWDEVSVSTVVAYQGFDLSESAEGISFGFKISRSF